jgi:hypothetical protein
MMIGLPELKSWRLATKPKDRPPGVLSCFGHIRPPARTQPRKDDGRDRRGHNNLPEVHIVDVQPARPWIATGDLPYPRCPVQNVAGITSSLDTQRTAALYPAGLRGQRPYEPQHPTARGGVAQLVRAEES